MDTKQPQVNPNVRFTARFILTLIKIVIFGFIGLVAITLLLFGAAFTYTSIADKALDEKTQAVVVAVNQKDTYDNSTAPLCSLSYEFSVEGGNKYTGETFRGGTEGYCTKTVGSYVAVRYDSTNPSSNSDGGITPLAAGIIPLAFGVALILVVVVLSARHGKRADRNNDGLTDDNMPVTKAQIAIIQNGMREIGEFWVPPRKMTQSEAREAIANLREKLIEQNKVLSPPK